MPRSHQYSYAGLIMGFFIALASVGLAQASKDHGPIKIGADAKSIVRMFYQPLGGEYFHSALLFRAVSANDPKLNTAPIFKDGRTAYISLPEMDRLITKLTSIDLDWKIISHAETPPTVDRYVLKDKLDVTIYSSAKTSDSFIDPKNICSDLAPIDSAFSTQRALWEFQLFRYKYHCEIRGFDPNAYPQRDVVNR